MGLRWENVMVCGAFAIAVGMICGNLVYLAVTYTPGEILSRLKQGDFELFQEGFVFYGGMIGGFLGAILGAVLIRCHVDTMLEAALPSIPFAHAIGRIGCFMAGCCHGMPYSGPLAVRDRFTGVTYFPVQLLEAVINSFIGLYLIFLVKRGKKAREILWSYLILYSIARFLLEYLRGDEIRGAMSGLSTSQWISVGIFALCVCQLLCRKK